MLLRWELSGLICAVFGCLVSVHPGSCQEDFRVYFKALSGLAPTIDFVLNFF